MAATWSFDHSVIYRDLPLRLAIANDLSLAIGSPRIDQKVILVQLEYQSNFYNLMHTSKNHNQDIKVNKAQGYWFDVPGLTLIQQC
jgi:hypothetical protein